MSRACQDIGTLGEEEQRVFTTSRPPLGFLPGDCFANLRSFPPSSGHQQGFCMMCIMEAHVRKVLYSSASAIRPRAIIRDLRCEKFQVLQQVFFPSLRGELLTSFSVIGEFKPDIPGDAYEFLRCTLSAMHRACLNGSNK